MVLGFLTERSAAVRYSVGDGGEPAICYLPATVEASTIHTADIRHIRYLLRMRWPLRCAERSQEQNEVSLQSFIVFCVMRLLCVPTQSP